MIRSTLLRAAAMIVALPALAVAQSSPQRGYDQPPRGFAGIDFTVAQPLGEFGDFIDAGFGVTGHFGWRLDSQGILAVRAQLGYLNYGHEKKSACLSQTVGCRIVVDVNTNNNIVTGGIGPQIMAPRGPIRPYLAATAGFSYFFTESSVEGTNEDNSPFASTTNQDSFRFSWTGGGGILIPIRSRSVTWMLDMGARYNGTSNAEYLKKGSIVDNPDGSITVNTIRSDANLVSYHFGVSIPIR